MLLGWRMMYRKSVRHHPTERAQHQHKNHKLGEHRAVPRAVGQQQPFAHLGERTAHRIGGQAQYKQTHYTHEADECVPCE